jgi:hypothetical protein
MHKLKHFEFRIVKDQRKFDSYDIGELNMIERYKSMFIDGFGERRHTPKVVVKVDLAWNWEICEVD